MHEPKPSNFAATTTDKTTSINDVKVSPRTVRHISRLQLIAVAFIGILLIVMASLGIYLRQRALIGTHLAGQSAQG
ncbi:hypothetical protein IPL68_03010 [Candidatus Saccharibacteria bacterium]|nr:MAG: hypothetical protein IPL68_03010 [Candidatus Saccharibacteria bacterium]